MNLILKITLTLLIVISFVSKNLAIQEGDNKEYPQVEELVKSLVEVSGIPGLSIAVSQKGKLLYAKGFGYADVERKIKMDTNTRLRTASVAKVITATALGKLASEGKISFDDPVKKYVSYAPKAFENLTIRELAGHTSGVAHRAIKSSQRSKNYTSIKEVIELLKNPKPDFPANESYSYSTAAYSLLAAIIEGASDMSYTNYMNEELFRPLGMTNTYPENIDSPKPNEAALYAIKNSQLRKEKKPVNGSYKLAGAGFRTTPTDLIKMTAAYHNGIIDHNTSSEMFTSNQLNDGTLTNVGIGWRNNRDIKNRITVDHAGSWQGARTVVVYYPKEKLALSIMINATSQMAIEETAYVIAQYFLESENFEPIVNIIDCSVNATITTDIIEECAGEIKINQSGKGTLKLTSSKTSLSNLPIIRLPGQNDYAIPTSFGVLFMSWEPTQQTGKIYLYQSRNQEDPTSKEALISIKSQ